MGAVITRNLGRVDYEATWQRMREFTDARTSESNDELWIVEHDPVFTQGVAGKPEHLLVNPANIPVVKTDRGGQITYHGPGQTVVYVMFNLKRAGYGVRELVVRIENAVIATLKEFGVDARGKRDAPGVYVDDAKIASLGLKIRNGCCYHGVALNVNMDLTPFSFINPCGYEGLRVTHLHDFGVDLPANDVGTRLSAQLQQTLTASA
ncbi:MAG: lipoyl(octanoyl) transferase LipB [Casimicrobium sp.]